MTTLGELVEAFGKALVMRELLVHIGRQLPAGSTIESVSVVRIAGDRPAVMVEWSVA